MRYILRQNVVSLTFLLSLTTYNPAAASFSESAAADSDTLFFHADMVNFASDTSDLSRLDIYTRVNFDDVQFIKTTAGFSGQYEISVSIYDDSDELIRSKQLRETLEVSSIRETASINDYQLSNIGFTLPPADYRVAMTVQDLETKREGHFEQRISLKDYSSDTEVMVSGLLYLEFYPRTKSDTINYVPRLTSIRRQDSNLNAYFEVYNLQENDSARVIYNIIDDEDETLKSGEYWIKGRSEDVIQSYFEIDAEDLPHGKYLTEVKIKTSTGTLKRTKAFDWLIEGVPLTFTLDQAIETLRYIASDQKIEELQNLEGREKHAAFLDFWAGKDPDPLTRGNDLRRRYYSRIKYANEHFDGMQQEGWQTDMGWVYVMLGPPDEVNRAPYISEYLLPGRAVKAAELWVYYHKSRELLFVDKNGFGHYRLVNTQDFYEMLR